MGIGWSIYNTDCRRDDLTCFFFVFFISFDTHFLNPSVGHLRFEGQQCVLASGLDSCGNHGRV